MKYSKIGPMLMALFLFGVLYMLPLKYWAYFLPEEGIREVAFSGDMNRFKNVSVQEAALQHHIFIPMYGSSTIGRFGRFHPSDLFTEEPVPFMVGESACTSIIHVLNFAALSDSLEHKKLVFMLDTGDLGNSRGIAPQRFRDLFSKLQAYDFVYNGKMDPDLKQKAAKRLLTFDIVKKDKLLTSLLENEAKAASFSWKNMYLKPSGYLYLKLLEKRDFIKAIKVIHDPKIARKPSPQVQINWDWVKDQAVQDAERQTKSNDYGMIDDFYKKSVGAKYEIMKNSWRPGRYLESLEYEDISFALDILSKSKANPMFVLIPKKGDWSDYIGFTKQFRDAQYDKIIKEVRSFGFNDIVDYRPYEYDKYFMRDFWHLGWTGWVQFDKDFLKYYQKESFIEAPSVATEGAFVV